MAFEFSPSIRAGLTLALGDGPGARLYLDAVEFLIDQELARNRYPEPTPLEQKAELSVIAEKASELIALLKGMSFDSALTLHVALVEERAPGSERHYTSDQRMMFFHPHEISREPPYFPDGDVISTFRSQLDLWSRVAGTQANAIEVRAGPRNKSARDRFVYRVVRQYYKSFDEWPRRGTKEAFHGVVQELCSLAGFPGQSDIGAVIDNAKRVINRAKKEIDSQRPD